jgi:hypothetical protein
MPVLREGGAFVSGTVRGLPHEQVQGYDYDPQETRYTELATVTGTMATGATLALHRMNAACPVKRLVFPP